MLRMIGRPGRRSDVLLPEPELPTVRTSREPLVVWRTWLIVPERRPGGDVVPLLTGLFGFPWRTAELDAKCTIQDWDRTGAPGRPTVDRHHRLIPDPDCTCGIYASRAALVEPELDLVPRGMPIATGFVELTGHILETDRTHRAQHARIAGPLTVLPGRMPLGTRFMTRAPRPRTVVTDRHGYRTRWVDAAAGRPYPEWRREVGRQLRHRYGVVVEGA